jgi:hypothetical protein
MNIDKISLYIKYLFCFIHSMDPNRVFHIEEETEFLSQRRQLSLICVVHRFQESGDLFFVLLVVSTYHSRRTSFPTYFLVLFISILL